MALLPIATTIPGVIAALRNFLLSMFLPNALQQGSKKIVPPKTIGLQDNSGGKQRMGERNYYAAF